MDLVMANIQGGSSSGVMRDYRKGNWTLQETMVLIQAKKMDDERRMKTERSGKPAELRWKWVEDYCWRNSCLRSQNQCNDKWDNLMRDFKRVREYEKRLAAEQKDSKSYWKLEKNERKGNNLPSNMLPQIYDALIDVVERKGLKGNFFVGASSSSSPALLPGPKSSLLPLPPPPPPPPPPPRTTTLPFSQQQPTVDSDTSQDENSDSPAKRRRRGEGSSETSNEVGTAISRSASLIAEAMHACEEREERRHRELLSMHERRLQIEESKAEITRQGIHGLVDAVNKLATSILSLASHSNPLPSDRQ